MAHIYSGSRLYPGLAQEYRLLLPRTYHYAPHTTLQIQATAPGTYHYAPHTTLQKYHHYKYDIIPVSISFPHPSVS